MESQTQDNRLYIECTDRAQQWLLIHNISEHHWTRAQLYIRNSVGHPTSLSVTLAHNSLTLLTLNALQLTFGSAGQSSPPVSARPVMGWKCAGCEAVRWKWCSTGDSLPDCDLCSLSPQLTCVRLSLALSPSQAGLRLTWSSHGQVPLTMTQWARGQSGVNMDTLYADARVAPNDERGLFVRSVASPEQRQSLCWCVSGGGWVSVVSVEKWCRRESVSSVLTEPHQSCACAECCVHFGSHSQ